MPEFLSKLLAVSNATEECENVSLSNTHHLNQFPGLRFYKVLMVVLPFINFVINGASFVVFRTLRRGNAFHGILMCLAASDALFQLVFGWLNLLLYLMESNLLALPNLGTARLIAGCMSAAMYTATVLHLVRNWLVVLISYYRHRTTSGVGAGKGWLLSPPVGPRVAVFLAICLIVSLPRCFEFSVVTCARLIQVTHIVGYLNSRLAYRIAYQGVTLVLLQNLGPLLLLTYFSVVLCRRVHRQSATRRSLSTAPDRHQAACTRLVFMLCAAFFLCETPMLAKAVDQMKDRLHTLGYVCNFLVCVDSTLNCLIYGFTNRQFAERLRQVCRRCRGLPEAPDIMLDLAETRSHRRLNNVSGRQLETAAVVARDRRTSVHVTAAPASAPSAL